MTRKGRQARRSRFGRERSWFRRTHVGQQGAAWRTGTAWRGAGGVGRGAAGFLAQFLPSIRRRKLCLCTSRPASASDRALQLQQRDEALRHQLENHGPVFDLGGSRRCGGEDAARIAGHRPAGNRRRRATATKASGHETRLMEQFIALQHQSRFPAVSRDRNDAARGPRGGPPTGSTVSSTLRPGPFNAGTKKFRDHVRHARPR